MPSTPYMTQKHFEVLADELAHDKFFYDCLIAYHEKLDRMIKYCQDSNPRFNLKKFTARIDKTYNLFDKNMRKALGGTNDN
tara:strand:+ start:94 stop:336 length:243 start_codon:yes stop_codon:yes gene_type:complete